VRAKLAQAWSILQRVRTTEHKRGASARWEQAVTSFRQQLTQLNRRIAAWNLKVPVAGFQRKSIDTEREIESVRAE
jgi:hypothetical protein